MEEARKEENAVVEVKPCLESLGKRHKKSLLILLGYYYHTVVAEKQLNFLENKVEEEAREEEAVECYLVENTLADQKKREDNPELTESLVV